MTDELSESSGALDVPLFEAVRWVATVGESIPFNPHNGAAWRDALRVVFGDSVPFKVRDGGAWENALDIVLAAWQSNQLLVYGLPTAGGFLEKIDGRCIVGVQCADGRCIVGVQCAPLYGVQNGHLNGNGISGGKPFLELWPRSDAEGWDAKGFDDKLYVPDRQKGWTHLRASRYEVRRIWSFGLQRKTHSGAVGRPTSRPLVEEELARRIKALCGGKFPETSVTAVAESLATWLSATHPDCPDMGATKQTPPA